MRRARGSRHPATRHSTCPTSTLQTGSTSNVADPGQMARIDAQLRMRAEAVEAVDTLLARVQATLAARGLAGNTYIVLSTANGHDPRQGEGRKVHGLSLATASLARPTFLRSRARAPPHNLLCASRRRAASTSVTPIGAMSAAVSVDRRYRVAAIPGRRPWTVAERIRLGLRVATVLGLLLRGLGA